MTKLDWAAVTDQVTADDQGKWDLLLSRDTLRFENGRLGFPRRMAEGHPNNLALTPWATGQFCQKLGMPAAYFRRCPPVLQDVQANHWLHAGDALPQGGSEGNGDLRWLLRAKGETLRGVLSERYTRIGNRETLGALAPLLSEKFQVRWFALTDESLHLRLTDPKLIRDVLPGDPVMAGLHIGNSEVGSRSITVDAMVYRLVCQNGLVRLVKGKSVFQQRHIGINPREMREALSNAVREAVMQSTAFIERLIDATRVTIDDPYGVIATIASDWILSRKVEMQIREALELEPTRQQGTLYGLVNAVTQVAQSLAPDERYTLETLAARLLESGPPAVRVTPRSSQRWEEESGILRLDLPDLTIAGVRRSRGEVTLQ